VHNLNIETTEKLLDRVGWEILCALQQDARLSYAEIGRRVGMSPPAVMERVRRMEDAGIITGYTTKIDLAKLGLTIQAIIRVRYPGDRCMIVQELAAKTPGVLQCHHVTGDDCLIIHVAVESMLELESLIGRFGSYGQTTTSIILSSPVTQRVIDRRDHEDEANGNGKH